MSKYKEIVDNIRHSYSSLSTYGHCPYNYYLAKILTEKERNEQGYEKESNFYAELGSFVHEILARILTGELSPDEALDYYVENYDTSIYYKTSPSIMEKAYEACADYLAEFNFDWLKGYEILGVELEWKLDIEDYPFIGYIDLLLRDTSDGKIVVLDHKSAKYPLRKDGKVKKASAESFESYKKQMYLYSYAVKQKYGEYPKEIVWNHFKEGLFVKIPFVQEEYEEAVRWFLETIKQIENDEDFVENNKDYFYCNNLCDFRHSCEYAKGQGMNAIP